MPKVYLPHADKRPNQPFKGANMLQERSDWRIMISLAPDLANDIKKLSNQLGINYQAMMKVLMDEALRARKASAKLDGE